MVPEDTTNSGARFVVGGSIRQFIIIAKRFAQMTRAEAACQRQFLLDDVFPDMPKRVDIRLIPGQRGHIRHRGVHIHGPDRMPHGFALFNHRNMILHVTHIP